MTRSLGGFPAAVLAGWLALGGVGWWLARDKGFPDWAALPVLAAFLIEYPFYLAAGFPAVRERLYRPHLALSLAVTAALPYLAACWGTGIFRWTALFQLEALVVALALWHRVLPRAAWSDAGFLALVAAALLNKYFHHIYPQPYPGMEAMVLGQLALIRCSAVALMVERGLPDAGYGFWPRRRDWVEGALHYLYFLPIGFPLGVALGVLRFGPLPPLWRTVATFFGILWVVALSEEYFFRGVIQRRLEEWTGRGWLAVVAASLLFGAVHLPFRGFPNWRFALVAAVAGLFYGRAYRRTGSIRSSMVAHALVVATWRALFS